jgi:PIN domain nuclease of toxin-antitoxin system
MKLLLDTHLLWWLDNSPLLPKRASTLITATENDLFVSTVSL